MKHREKFDVDDRARLNEMERSNGRHLCSRAIRNKEIARVEERKLVCERHERRFRETTLSMKDPKQTARERYEQE